MKKNWNILIWVLAAVIVMVAVYTVYNKNKSSVQPEIKQLEERSAAPDFTLKDLDGNDVKLSDFRGKVVFLNFWATWCPYCVEEMPDLQKANDTLAKEGKAVILAVDVAENSEIVKKYVSDKKLSLKVLLDTDGRIADIYKVTGIPITFIINRDGTIYNYMGATKAETILNLVKSMK